MPFKAKEEEYVKMLIARSCCSAAAQNDNNRTVIERRISSVAITEMIEMSVNVVVTFQKSA